METKKLIEELARAAGLGPVIDPLDDRFQADELAAFFALVAAYVVDDICEVIPMANAYRGGHGEPPRLSDAELVQAIRTRYNLAAMSSAVSR